MNKSNESTAKAYKEDFQGMSFEDAMRELETIVKKLESGNTTLEESIEDYLKGTALKEHCYKKLSDARLKVEQIVQQADGAVSSTPIQEKE